MKKKKTIAQEVEAAAVLLQKYVRLKAADPEGYARCVTCGEVYHWKELQGGHYIERTWTATKLLEENVNPQCRACNGGFGGRAKGNLRKYTFYMQDMYGREFVEELETLKHQPKKYTREEIKEIQDDLKGKIRDLEGE